MVIFSLSLDMSNGSLKGKEVQFDLSTDLHATYL